MRSVRLRAALWVGMAVVVLGTVWVAADPLHQRRGARSGRPAAPAGLPVLAEQQLGSPLLIVAPHPDDETLGCNGLIQQARARGAEAYVVIMTNGEGYRAERTLMAVEESLEGTVAERLQLARQREQESLKALKASGVPRDHVFFLGYPGAGLPLMWQSQHWSRSRPWHSKAMLTDRNPFPSSFSRGAPHAGEQALADLITIMARVRPTAVFTTPPYDIHPTHWATCNFVLLALAQHNGRAGQAVPLYWYLVHYPHWPVPWGYAPSQALRPPPTWAHRPGLPWFALPLTEEEVRHKTRCLDQYVTQGAPHSAELRSFLRGNELFACPSLSAEETVPTVVHDPVRNLPADWVAPEEDIIELSLAWQSGQPLLSLRLAAPPDPALRYTIVWHSVSVPNRPVASFVWHGSRGALEVSAVDGSLRSLPAPCDVRGSELVARLPEDALIGSPVTLDAFCQRGRHYANHTLTSVVRFPLAGPVASSP